MSIKRLAFSSFSGLIAKAVSVLVIAAQVPLAKGGLAPEEFGIWMLLTSLLMFLQLADFGIGNGLVTIISSHVSEENSSELKQAISTTVLLLGLFGGILLLIALFVIYGVSDWISVFKVATVTERTIQSTLTIFSLFLASSIPASIGQKILWGFQEVHIANLWQIISSLVTFLIFVPLVWLSVGLEWLVATSVFGPFVVLTVCSLDQFMRRHKQLDLKTAFVSLQMTRRLFKLGGAWTIYQTLFFIATSADGIFVTRLFGAEAMGSYGLIARMMSGLSVALFFTVPLWPMFANAIAKSDEILIKRYFLLALVICGAIGIATSIALYLFAQPIAIIWAGPDVMPTMPLVLSFSAWVVIYNIWAGISSLMANELMMKRMVFISALGCLIAIGLKIPMANQLGPSGVCWASVIGVGLSSILGFYILTNEVYQCRSPKT